MLSKQTASLLSELHAFISGTAKIEPNTLVELTKTALCLLKNLPATRTALFQFFSTVMLKVAANYIELIENEIKTGEIPTPSETDETVVTEICQVLSAFVADNPNAWAPIVSTWSLELLGEISTKFAGRAHISTSLNETLTLWMNCRATKLLVDINTKCLSSLMHSDTETCINALLDTSIKHSPNFDWVVAHVGSCFPHTVITRVLSCGLKDFSQIKSYEQGSNSPKLRSVVGILGHLAASHTTDIRSAILEIFYASLTLSQQDDESAKLQKKATIPFILQLSFLSTTLFQAICADNHFLNVEIILKLCPFIDDWCRYFGTSEILEDLLLTLIMSCERGGYRIINLLLDCAQAENEAVSDKSLELLQNVLYRLDDCTRHTKQIEILTSLAHDLDDINRNLIDTNTLKAETAAHIVILIGHFNPSMLISAVSHLFQNATNLEQLSLLVRILSHELIDKTVWPYENAKRDDGGHFSVVLEQIFSQNSKFHSQTWENLLVLLKWEKSGQVEALRSNFVSRSIQSNMLTITLLFAQQHDPQLMHLMAEMFHLLDTNFENLSIEVILNLTQGMVNYFFVCCMETESTLKKVKGFEFANRQLRKLCNFSKVAKVLALRELLERALFRCENVLFGTKNVGVYDESNSNKLLIDQNKKINKTIPLTKHSSVFNGGIIGLGKRKLLQQNAPHPQLIRENIKQLINLIKSCCSEQQENTNKLSEISLDSVTLVSLLLVQFVSPDVMYNGLPWPDEEFSKVTIERDLFICRLFKSAPVLWDLLNFVAIHRPALCYCSVLLRAITATLIHQWKSMGGGGITNSCGENEKSLMSTTIKVIDTMALGQLLPPPLSNIRDLVPHLKCFEIVAILRDSIWCYLRDLIPSPALFVEDGNNIYWRDPLMSRPAEIYTNTLRIIMQKNIESLGHLYAQMFINIPK